ncbi:MAG TPA: hypothetical protein VGD95_02610 [Micavibrio sp.]
MNDLSDKFKSDDFSDIKACLQQAGHPQPPHDLAARITQRAAFTPQKHRQNFSSVINDWTRELMSWITVPRPALSFGLCLMIGLFSGWAASRGLEAEDTIYDVARPLDMVVIEEEWL